MPSLVDSVRRRQLQARPRVPGLPADLSGRMDEHAFVYPAAMSPGRRLGRSVLGLAVLCATALGAVRIDHYWAARHLRAAARSIEVAAVEPVSSRVQLVLPGETAAWHESTVYSRVGGTVVKWFVDIGDKVEQGEVLCLLDTPDIDAKLAAARAELGASRAQVLVRQADADFARTTYERWRDSPKGVVSDQERAAKRAEYARAAAQLAAARAQVAIDEVRVERYAALTRLRQVRAPLSGVITGRDIDIGRAVSPAGAASPTSLYRLVQDDPIRVFVQASQSVAADLMRPGVPARVAFSGASAVRPYRGNIARTAASFGGRSRTMRVEVDLRNPRHELVPGMSAKVAFSVPPRGRMEVPAAAVLMRSGAAQIAEVDASRRLRFHDVRIARNDGETIELASGARPGDLVAVSVGPKLSDGDLVKVSRRLPGAPSALVMTVQR